MKITAVYCGPLSAAQRSQFGTTAAGGLIYRYANDGSSGVTGSAKLYVGFTADGGIARVELRGNPARRRPGQVRGGRGGRGRHQGQDLNFSGCEIMSYALVTSTGVDPVSYAG